MKLCEGFDALRDLPEGWAVVGCGDSGANYAVISAGEDTLRHLWNHW